MSDIDAQYRQGRQAQAAQAMNDQKFQERKLLFQALRRHIPEIAQGDYSTPESASALYNALGRSSGMIERIMEDRRLLRRVIECWFKLAAQGDVPSL
jgi:hypothetical protein